MADLEASSGISSGWRNPRTVFFHMLFRSAAVLTYIFCTAFSSSFTINFIAVVCLVSFDFWTVKNVTGRLLVGLRWWNEVKIHQTVLAVILTPSARLMNKGTLFGATSRMECVKNVKALVQIV